MKINRNLLLKDVTDIRRRLHTYPETGFKEFETSRFIADYLMKLGIEVKTGIAETGVIGIIRGNPGSASVAVRADMDCLNVTEDSGVEFCSKNPGFMHACGHDGHMAAALGLAKYLSLSCENFKNNILFIFQPAEEGPGGAKAIVESGVLDDFNVKSFLAMHIYPGIEQGKIGCCPGPITARNGEVDIEVKGKSCHGALPHLGVDSIVTASQLIQSVQSIVSRRIDPMESAVATFGRIYGGEARNIVSGRVTLEGTIRAFSEDVYNIIKDSIVSICRGIGDANGCSIDAEVRDMYPETFNDAKLFETLRGLTGSDDLEIIKPLMIAEDFSYYRSIAPELMFLLGSGDKDAGFTYPLHSSRFNFNEEILIKGIYIFADMIKALET